MTNQEMLSILKGDREAKLRLFNELTDRVQNGEPLTDDEIPIFETLKKELLKVSGVVVSMEAQLFGRSGTRLS